MIGSTTNPAARMDSDSSDVACKHLIKRHVLDRITYDIPSYKWETECAKKMDMLYCGKDCAEREEI